MTFEEYWGKVAKLKVFPEKAIQQLPGALREDTKQKLMRLSPEDSSELLSKVIDLINHGSVESINSLVRKRL